MSCVDAQIIRALVEHVGMDPDGVPLGQPITGEAPVAVNEDRKISLAVNSDDFTVADGKLKLKGTAIVSTRGLRLPCECTKSGNKLEFKPLEDGSKIPVGTVIIVKNQNGLEQHWVVVKQDTSANATYPTLTVVSGMMTAAIPYVAAGGCYTSANLLHYGDITDEYGLFYRGLGQGPNHQVATSDELWGILTYVLSKLA